MGNFLRQDQLPDSNKIPMWIGKVYAGTFRWPSYVHRCYDWCGENCTGRFDITLADRDGKIVWLFEHESDAMWFLMRWKNT